MTLLDVLPEWLRRDSSPDSPGDLARKPPSSLARHNSGFEVGYGSFVELGDGYTHYELTGHERDPLVVLVHGLTTSLFVWDYQMTALRRSGFRVLRYDLYGRGLSDRPSVRYDAGLFHRQLRELLDATVEEEPDALVGLSLGGAVAVGSTARDVVRPGKLFLVAPAGLRRTMPWWFYLMVLPGVLDMAEYGFGNWFWPLVGPRNLTTDPGKRERARREMRTQLMFGGFHRALISTLRHGPLYGLGKDYRELGRRSLPVRALWSREDRVVPSRMAKTLKQYVPGAEVVTVREGRHTVNYDRPELVNPTLLDFLGR